MEALYESGIADTLNREDAPIGSGVEGAEPTTTEEATGVTKQTTETLMAGERIMEALDLADSELAVFREYEEAKAKEDQFVTDVDQWEASQTKHSTFKTGAMDKQEIVEDYEYVFDESQTIQFVLGNTMDQDSRMTPAERLLKQQIEEAEKRGKMR